jgi:branched-subunit amino acid transport protein
MEPATHSLLVAGAIAAFIRAFIPVLKSKKLGDMWSKAPKWLRPALLVALTAALALCDALVSGGTISHALLAALAALGAATASYETQKSLKKAKKGDGK